MMQSLYYVESFKNNNMMESKVNAKVLIGRLGLVSTV